MGNLLIALMLYSITAHADKPTYTTRELSQPHALGLKRDPAKLRAFKMTAAKSEKPEAAVPVPRSLDLSSRVSLPENQGQCGSCWAFGITKALRSALMLAGADPGTLAFNYLVNNCGGVVSEYGCNGGDFDAGRNFLSGRGPWLERNDPYIQSDRGRCLGLPPAGTALSYKVVGNGQTAPTFQELATALAAQHMLVVDVAVVGSWEYYAGGIYNGSGSGINHIVNMNGYDCETSVDAQGNCLFDSRGMPRNGDGYLIVMNNWGEYGWGEVNPSNGHGGYMRTRWGRNQIAETAMYFEVTGTPIPPTPTPIPPIPPAPSCRGFWCVVTKCALPWCR